MEIITKTVEANGNPTEIIMSKMMRPCSQEELDAMSVEERDRCKFMGEMSGRSWEFRHRPYLICPNSRARIRVTGVDVVMQ